MKTVAQENEVCVRRYARVIENIQADPSVPTKVVSIPEDRTVILKKRREVADFRMKAVCW